MADEVSNTGVPQGTGEAQETTSASNPELEQARAALEEQKRINAAQKQQYEHFRQQFQQQAQEHQQYQQYQEPPDNDARQAQMKAQQDDYDRQELGMLKYKVNNPNWNETWGQVSEIINDPVKAQEVTAFDALGKPDYGKSLQAAQRLVELEQLRQLKSQTEEAKKASATEQDRQKAQATISGSSASAGEEVVDTKDMTPQEMVDAGLIDVDPNDPIRDL